MKIIYYVGRWGGKSCGRNYRKARKATQMLGLSRSKPELRKPRLPDGVRIYAISDIHGCADLLRQMFTVIDRDLSTCGSTRAIHVFLGDYIDRGPDSSQTIDLLIERGRKHEYGFPQSNHEAFLFDVLKDPSQLESWNAIWRTADPDLVRIAAIDQSPMQHEQTE